MRVGAALVRQVVASTALTLTVASGVSRTPSPVVSGFSRTPGTPSRFEFAQPHMGTTVRVVLYTHDETKARTLADRAFARIGDLDARLSDYRTDSELMLLCRAAGGPPQAISDDLFAVLSAAQQFARASDGAFDVTVGPLSRLWRRARVAGQPPDPAALAAARALVGYEHLEVASGRARLAKPGMLLDVGGIAKGYAADEALRVLRDGGAPSALVAIGGDIAAGDPPPAKDGWTIALAPLGPRAHTDAGPLVVRNAGVSTSGDAEQFVEHEGTRYSHVLSPHTGSAVEGRSGVTVRARDAMSADALATAVAALGRQRGLTLVDDAGAAALFVESTPDGVREYRSARW